MANKRAEIIAQAQARLGVPYRLDPPPDGIHTLDCSLYVLQVAKAVGLPLPSGIRTAEQIRQATIPVEDWKHTQPGDLLFFENTYNAAGPAGPDGKIASHIGISLGAGTQRMLNSVEPVSKETDISTDYWQEKLFDIRRIPGINQNVDARVSHGIDVSNHQGPNIDWARVAADGVSFAFMKASESDWFIDKTFTRNWIDAGNAGIIRGAYHFGRPEEESKHSATDEVELFIDVVKQAGGFRQDTDMAVLDLESGQDSSDWALAWMEAFYAQTGIIPLLYTGKWVDDFSDTPDLADYPLWLAAYQTNPPRAVEPWSELSFWQFTDKGNIGGINPVDRNYYLGSKPLAEFARELHGDDPDEEETTQFEVGPGLREMMAQDKTSPAGHSMFLPLGRNPAQIEQAYGLNGVIYSWTLENNKGWRHRPQ